MTDKEVMQMALTALCNSSQPARGYRRNELHLTPKPHIEIYQEAIEALRAALAQPETEFNPDWDALAVMVEEQQRTAKCIEELKQREWQGLTQDDIYQISEKCGLMDAAWEDVMHAIEAKLKEKNT